MYPSIDVVIPARTLAISYHLSREQNVQYLCRPHQRVKLIAHIRGPLALRAHAELLQQFRGVVAIHLGLGLTAGSSMQRLDEGHQSLGQDQQVARVWREGLKCVRGTRGDEDRGSDAGIHLTVREPKANDSREDAPRLVISVMHVEFRGSAPRPLAECEGLPGGLDARGPADTVAQIDHRISHAPGP